VGRLRKSRCAALSFQGVVALLGVAVAACSPELDWRELRSDEGCFVAMLPGKPSFGERELSGKKGVVMRLWSAQAGGAAYGVGYADYPLGNSAVIERTRDALAANIRGRIVEDREFSQGLAKGREFRAEGPDAILAARLLMAGPRLYQVAVVGQKESVKPHDIDMFLSSFRLVAADRRNEITCARTPA
jgi:hypothetical protein